MNWKVLGISAGLTIVVPLMIVVTLGILCHDPGVAGSWSFAIPIVTGIIVGECVFFILNTLAKRNYVFIRSLASILSGLIAFLAGGFIGMQIVYPIFHSLVFAPHPDFALNHEDFFFYQGAIIVFALVAGLVGLIFGTGIGQHKKQLKTDN
ncbi:hypothetical protein LLG46_05025 [bacterium]|nr:hypothetical protein [bacterium]